MGNKFYYRYLPVRHVVRQEGLGQRQGPLMRIQDDVARKRVFTTGGRATRPGQRAVLRRFYQCLERTDHGILHRRGRAGAFCIPRALRHRAIRCGDPDIAARGRRGGRRRGDDRAATGRSIDDVQSLDGRHPPILAVGAFERTREIGLPVHSVVHLISLLRSGACFVENISINYSAY